MPKGRIAGAPKINPWEPADYELPDVVALQALHRGEADADQQKRAMSFIIEKACATYDVQFRPGPDGDRSTCFAAGKAFVGQQLVKLLHLNHKALKFPETP